ncbi:MAG: abhydrolase domain-containing 18, partial [Moraxellaceae bacterium]|nr:abhydrolase domain-containing 18 [Moraxellaceae bacterium]
MEKIAQYVSRVANETYGHSRRLMPEQPWWDNLDPAFHKFPDDFYLDLKSQAMVGATAAVDLSMRTALAAFTLGLALPSTLRPGQIKQDAAQFSFYKDMADTHDSAHVFQRPQQKVQVRHHPAGRLSHKLDDGRIEVLSFESNFRAVNPAMREKYAKHRRNRLAWAEHWRHDGPARPTICMIHGFVADPYWINSRWLAMPWFYKQGYDVLMYTLPFHGRRQEAMSPFSGHGYFSHGFSHINETIAHSIHDFRLYMDYLEGLGAPGIGVTGISLGGFTTSLLAAVEDRLAFAIPNVPLASIVDLVLEWSPISEVVKTGLRLAGMDIREARHIMAAT